MDYETICYPVKTPSKTFKRMVTYLKKSFFVRSFKNTTTIFCRSTNYLFLEGSIAGKQNKDKLTAQ